MGKTKEPNCGLSVPEGRLQEKWRDYLQQITLPAWLLQGREVLVQDKHRESGRAYLVFFPSLQKPSLEEKIDWPLLTPLLQHGFESWMSNPPPSCQIETFVKSNSVSWLLYVFILLTGWYLDPHFFPLSLTCHPRVWFIKRMKGSPTCLKRGDGK